MKRSKSHMIGDSFKAYLYKVIIPIGWIPREKHIDYGIDFELEIVKDEEVTGKIVWLQVRSTENINISGNKVKFRIKLDLLKYFINCVFPVILLVYDNKKKIGYWIWIQRYIHKNEEILFSEKKTVTVNIPIENVFHNTLSEIEEIAKIGPSYLNQYKLGILSEVVQKGEGSIVAYSSMLQRKWNKEKIYDRMNGYGLVSENEIKSWFQDDTDNGTELILDTPVGKYKIFTPIVPDLYETLEEMVKYGMIEIKLESPFIQGLYAVLDDGFIYKNKLMFENKNGEWEVINEYPEILFECRNISRKKLSHQEMHHLREKEPSYFYKK